MRNDLWDRVAFHMEVSAGNVGQAERNNVAHPLDLVDDGISVR